MFTSHQNMTKFLAPKHIVVYADDDADDIELVEDAFKRYATNVEVITFKDASQALSYLKNQTDLDPLPCLIILDINMPLMDGKEALMRLRQLQRYEATPVVLFTTSSLPLDKDFARRYEAGFITKPLGYEQMELITKEFINHCTEETQKKIRRIN
jgi:CheY-like chemotaxis protein